MRQKRNAARNTFELGNNEWPEAPCKVLRRGDRREDRMAVCGLSVPPDRDRAPIAEIEPAGNYSRPCSGSRSGRHETAHCTKQIVGQVFRYAIATGRATRDSAADLRGALTPVVTRHHAAVTDLWPGALLRAQHRSRARLAGAATRAARVRAAWGSSGRPSGLRSTSRPRRRTSGAYEDPEGPLGSVVYAGRDTYELQPAAHRTRQAACLSKYSNPRAPDV